jgi:hypothetical protein
MLINVMADWTILRTFRIFYDQLVQFVFIWYVLSGLGIMHQEKSGNPGEKTSLKFIRVTAQERQKNFKQR